MLEKSKVNKDVINKGSQSECYKECIKVIKKFLEAQGGAYSDSISYVDGTVYKECEDGSLDWITPIAKVELTEEGVNSKGKVLYRQLQAVLLDYDIASMSFTKLNPMVEKISIQKYENFSYSNIAKSIIVEEGLNVTCLMLENDINEIECCGISEVVRAKLRCDYYKDFDVTVVITPTVYNKAIDCLNRTTDYYEISMNVGEFEYEINRLSEVSNYLNGFNKDILKDAHNKKFITIFAYASNRNKKSFGWNLLNKRNILIMNHLLDI